MKRNFRKYHRSIALIIFLPLILTVLTGMLKTMVADWGLNIGITGRLLMDIHTGEIFHLAKIYPILNGLGLIGLLVTGLNMSGLLRKKTTN